MGSSEIDFEAAWSAMPPGALLLTRDLVIVAANDSCVRWSGRPREEIVGRTLFDAFPHDPSDPEEFEGRQALRRSIERVFATGNPETMPLQKNSAQVPGRPDVFEERYWSQMNIPVPGPDGRVALVINRFEEVTSALQRLRRLEPDTPLRAQLEVIENEVNTRSRELQDLNERLMQAYDIQRRQAEALKEAVERQRQFVSDASHDLRTPITGLQIRLEDALADPDADPQQVLQAVLQDAMRLNDLVSDLLELSRLDAGAPAPVEDVDLAELATEEVRRQSLTHHVSLHLEPGVVVRASRIRMSRLLGNLLTNADRHAEKEIQIIISDEAPEAVLEVRDDGQGILKGEHEKIFERFHRSALSRKKDPRGTGLGLSIAREIAKTYGGRLYATDNPAGRGARLVLRLPLAGTGTPADRHGTMKTPEAAPGRR
ncbi:PAS domain-containing sensor histidine kinase [Actinocorallia sp. B10E7]|uniref:PAS domain-containing sensor histidine kinase n=1 Tax=Actinocorallia sp. B10E7 TaxID=3153558 RepID=UPI00325CB932